MIYFVFISNIRWSSSSSSSRSGGGGGVVYYMNVAMLVQVLHFKCERNGRRCRENRCTTHVIVGDRHVTSGGVLLIIDPSRFPSHRLWAKVAQLLEVVWGSDAPTQ